MSSVNNILIVENLYPLQTRSLRIEKSLEKYGFNVHSAMWNRNGVEVTEDDQHYIFSRVSRNKLKKLASIRSYYNFVKEIIAHNTYDVLIASHWDMLFLCSLLKKNGQVLIYDNLDMPTHKYWMVRKIFKFLEIKALKKTDGVLYASRFFPKFYSPSKKSLILENKPLKYVYQGFKELPTSSKTTISFFGTLRYVKSLKILMDAAAKCDNINLVIRGSGFAEELISYAKSKKYANVSLFVGWFDYGDLGKLVSETDVIWAAYPSKDFNVKYAISNKFFEAMVFNKPGIFSENTRLGKFVGEKNIGFTVDPYDVSSIEKLFEYLQNNGGEIIKTTKKKLKAFAPEDVFWEDEEQNLISFIRSLK